MKSLSWLKALDYTDIARRFVVHSPMLSYIAIQVMFWILANNLMGLILHYHSLLVGTVLGYIIQSDLPSIVRLASLLGLFYGVVLGTFTYRVERRQYGRQSFARITLIKLVICTGFGLFVFGQLALLSTELTIPFVLPTLSNPSAEKGLVYSLIIFMLFYFIMSLLIGFINLVNTKYGPGILLPLMLGKYTTPIEEERIFLFMDLQSSTALAEKLGHLTYSSFIRDCFWDINNVLARYNAEIYQYAGDEIITLHDKT
jgi:adenylate cyclase